MLNVLNLGTESQYDSCHCGMSVYGDDCVKYFLINNIRLQYPPFRDGTTD